jgi:predicted DNA-binding transcriptional regulator YafY
MFRLSRVEGEVQVVGEAGEYDVPEGAAADVLARTEANGPTRGRARLRVREGSGQVLRRRAGDVRTDLGDAATPGWHELTLDADDLEALAEELVAYGDAVVALEPPELRAAVVRRLRAVLGSAGAAA